MDLSQKIPAYLTEKHNIVKLVIFTSMFALVFINIYSPFGVSSWYNVTKMQLLFYSSLIILTGVLVVIISRLILYAVVRRRNISVSIAQYLIWITAEIFFMALFYTLYEKLFLQENHDFFDTFKISMLNTALIILLPYSVSWLYFSWNEKNQQLQDLSHSWDGMHDLKEMIPFKDEKGVMRISVKLVDLLYLQAADNYVTIVYNSQQKLAKYLLRASLKQIESELKGSPLIRCHRSYMVNFEKVKIIRRESDGLRLELDSPAPTEIPVSKTFMDGVFKAFGQTG